MKHIAAIPLDWVRRKPLAPDRLASHADFSLPSRNGRTVVHRRPRAGPMNKLVASCAVSMCALGVLYGASQGPFLEDEGVVISARSLLSSGGEDGVLIATGLMSFIVSALVSVNERLQLAILKAIYTLNFLACAFCLFLANLDTPLWRSVA